MSYRNGNYSAFYVKEPFAESNLNAHAAQDFVSYNLLRAWKALDESFPFNDSHAKNYNVRDGSDWEYTLKPRLRDRLNKSKNIILFLSSVTKNSMALREEIAFGVGIKELPVIVVYPDHREESDIIDCSSRAIKKCVQDLWDAVPVFRDTMSTVPTIHIPLKKILVERALNDPDLMIKTKCAANVFFYNC